MHIYILDNRYHQSSTNNQLAQATVSQGRYDMRRGDNDDKIGIFVQGTISVSSVAQPCLFVIFIQQKKKERKMKKRKGTQASEVLLLVRTHERQQLQHLRSTGYVCRRVFSRMIISLFRQKGRLVGVRKWLR